MIIKSSWLSLSLNLIFLIIFLINFIDCQEDINNVKSNYTLKSVNVLDTQVKIVSGSVYFEEPIYLLESYTCPNSTCVIPPDADTCPPCDYTHKGCDAGYSNRPSTCSPCNELFSNTYDKKPCELRWTDLELGVEQEGFVSTVFTTYALFRFYAPPKCVGYKVSVKTMQGAGLILGDLVPFFPPLAGTSRTIQSEEIDAQIIFCPQTPSFYPKDPSESYPNEYPYGTINIGITNKDDTDYIFKILIEEIDITPPPALPPPTCTNVTQDYQCLNDGQYVFIEEVLPVDAFLKYSFTFDQCKNITISTVTLSNDADIYVTDDESVALSSFSPDNFKWSSTYSLDDNLVIQLCPESGKSSKTIYIGIYAFYETDIYFYISTFGTYKLKEITDNPSLAGTWALTGSTKMVDTNTGKEALCENYDSACFSYFPVYPRQINNPLYPVPGTFKERGQSLSKFSGIALNETNPPKSNVYQYGLLVSLGINGIIYDYITEDTLPTTRMVFLDKLVYGNGTAIKGSVSIGELVTPECNYIEFSKVDKKQTEILDTLENSLSTTISGLRYYLDVLSFGDDYSSCQQMAEKLFIYNSTTSIQNTTTCIGTTDMTQYLEDPCCSTFATFSKCCKRRPESITKLNLVGVDIDLVNDQCAFPDCAESVLNTFSASVSGTQYQECSVGKDEESYYPDSLYQVFRGCQSVYVSANCVSNSDCNLAYPGKNYQCNSRNGLCLVPYKELEYTFIECILDNIPPPLKTEVINSKNLSNILVKKDLIQALHTAFSFKDCLTDYGAPSWSKLSFSYTSGTSVNSFCYPYATGFDQSAMYQSYDNCYQGLNIYAWVAESYQEESCNSIARCDWMGYEGRVSSDPSLIEECNEYAPEHFCGDCSDPVRNCYTDNTFTDQSTCETNNYVCYRQDHNQNVFANSDLVTVNDPNECSELTGSCSVGCGYQCSDHSGCFIPAAGDPLNCDIEIEGTYGEYWDDQCIYYYLSETQCSAQNGSTFKSCSSFSYDQCTICDDLVNGCDSFGLYCGVEQIPCQNQQECETAGSCSDEFYFDYSLGDQYFRYPSHQPRCTFPRKALALFTNSLPTCEFQYQQDTPLGCYNFSLALIDQTVCENQGGRWWGTFSKTKQECDSYQNLCYGKDPSPGFFLPLTYRFNEKNQEDCACSGETWKKPFEWTQGIWTPGVAVPLKWIKTNTTEAVTYVTNFRDSLEQGRFFSAFKDAASSRTTLLYKSEILCRNSNSKNSLEALACGCSKNGNGDSCYDNLVAPILQVLKPCNEQSNTTIFNNGLLLFSTGSIRENSCVSMSVGQIYKDTFLSKRVIALSSTFVSFEKPDDYSIFNENKAVIGKVLADGVTLEIFDSGIYDFKLCIEPTISLNQKKNPYIDFAILTDEHAGKMKPLNCEVSKDQSNRYCCKISAENTNVEQEEQVNEKGDSSNENFIKVGIDSYFLIERIGDWENEPFRPFNKTSTGLLYTLAVFFCLMGIYGLVHIGFFILQKVISTEPFKLVHLLFLVLTAFCLIRSVYFFILPSGIISETTTVGSYILVVLPTFLYFTSFTIVIVIWYMLSNASSFSTDIYRRINMMILLINALLYIIFIIIIIVFNFTKENSPATCGGRILVSLSQTTPQNVVSIFYAVVQAVLSLAIGVAFIYYGRLIYNKLSALTPQSSPTASKQQNRTFLITLICSTGFVLHCIFIIILVSVNPSNIIFSFVCLIATEMVPVIVLFVTNNQVPIGRYSKRGIKSIVKMRSSTTASYTNDTESIRKPKSSSSSSSTSH